MSNPHKHADLTIKSRNSCQISSLTFRKKAPVLLLTQRQALIAAAQARLGKEAMVSILQQYLNSGLLLYHLVFHLTDIRLSFHPTSLVQSNTLGQK